MSGCALATTASASIRAVSRNGRSQAAPASESSGCASGPRCCAGRSRFTRRRQEEPRSSRNYHWRKGMQVERRPIRVMLVEDHNLVRAGIRAVIDGQSDIQVIAEATEGRQAIRLARANCPDVAVVDVAMPNMSGIEVTREIRRLCPQTQVLILTAHDNEEYFFQTLKAGAVGYVLKKAAASDLIAAIEAASKGEPYLYPSVARLLVSDYLQRAPERETFEPLSDREREVLRLVAEGKTNRQIADSLFLSIKTVQTHRDHIMKKLHMHDRTDLVKYAIRKGLIEADS